MKRMIKMTAASAVAAAVVCTVIYRLTFLSLTLLLAITFWTVAYHFVMRLAVGFVFNKAMHNRADYHRRGIRSCRGRKSSIAS